MQDCFGPFWPNGPFWPCPSLRGAKTQKSAMVTMVTLLFGNKSVMVRPMVSLWSLWSGRGGGLLGKRSDHSDHGLTIGVTIAPLLPNKRVTIVTIALFRVLARGSQWTRPKRAIWPKWAKIGHNISRHNRARCGGEQQGDERRSAKQTKNGHFRRQTQLTLAPEWFIWNRKGPIWNRKGTKKLPRKNCQAFSLVLGV
jgi:hypothetical protein